MRASKDLRLAVIIDADNVSAAPIQALLAEIATHGKPTVRRIYGDWTQPNMNAWKAVLHEHAITPVQQYRHTTGKNATDSAMIIDAMDILYAGNVEGFCIVSSDADFTRLATRLREAGMRVLGFGARQTPKPFVAACEQFIYLEVLHPTKAKAGRRTEATAEPTTPAEAPDSTDTRAGNDQELALVSQQILTIIDSLADEEGWAPLAAVGHQLVRQKPDFDPRLYGFRQLSRLVEKLPEMEIERRADAGGASHMWLRHRE